MFAVPHADKQTRLQSCTDKSCVHPFFRGNARGGSYPAAPSTANELDSDPRTLNHQPPKRGPSDTEAPPKAPPTPTDRASTDHDSQQRLSCSADLEQEGEVDEDVDVGVVHFEGLAVQHLPARPHQSQDTSFWVQSVPQGEFFAFVSSIDDPRVSLSPRATASQLHTVRMPPW